MIVVRRCSIHAKYISLLITTGSGDIMEFNGSIPRVLYKPKIPPAENQGDVLLSRSGSAKLELFSTQVIDSEQRPFHARGLAERSTVSTDVCHLRKRLSQVRTS